MFKRFEAEIFVGVVFAMLVAFQVWLLSLPVPELELAESPTMEQTDSVVYKRVGVIESISRR